MENMKHNKKYLSTFFLFSVAYIVIYAPMLAMHYATDTYYALMNANIFGLDNISLGRWVNTLIYKLLIAENVDYSKCFRLFMLLIIGAFSFFSTMCYWLLNQVIDCDSNVRKRLGLFIAVILPLGNVFALEWLTFWECAIQWALSIIFMGIGLYFAQNEKTWSSLCSYLFLVLSLGCYQASISIFISIGCLLVYIKAHGSLDKDSIKKTLRVIAISAGASVTNILSIKFFQITGITIVRERTGGLSLAVIGENIRALFKFYPDLLVNNLGFIPRYLSAGLMIALLVYCLLVLARRQRKWVDCMYLLLLLAGMILSIIVPHIFTSSIWLPQRTLVGYWSAVSALIVIAIFLSCDATLKLRRVPVEMVAYALALVNLLCINRISAETLSSNRIDKEHAYAVQEAIEAYEEDTGNAIEYIGCIGDVHSSYRHIDAKYTWYETNISAFNPEWSDVNCINYLCNENYIRITVEDEDVIACANNNDWNYLSLSEQLIFKGNVCYLIKY